MKRFVSVLLSICVILMSCACAKKVITPTWQEQYNLGIKYLSEGNYEEAILAFTAAIEIDPKQVRIYVSRAEAYIWSGETEENMAAALADYETALELDDTLIEAWLGLADVYIRQGGIEKAIEVLRQALDKIGEDSQIITILEELESAVGVNDADASLAINGSGRNLRVSVTVPGLPREFYVADDNIIDAQFQVLFSDGTETFFIGTQEKRGAAGMIPVPDRELTYTTVGPVVYDSEEGDIIWDNTNHTAETSRDGDTIIWNLELPEWSCNVEDIQYIGYNFWYETEESKVNLIATYSVSNGETTYYSDTGVEDLGYILNGEETRYHTMEVEVRT